VEIRIKDFVAAIADGEYKKALDIIKENSLLPAICGRVCPQEVQCQAECTELGLNHLIPVVYERTVKQARSGKAVERWRRMGLAAAKQSRRVWLPRIEGPVRLE